MFLRFPKEWRIRPPKSSSMITESIPGGAIEDFWSLIRKTATQGDLQHFLEHFKGHFCLANGNPHFQSSSTSWSQTDLDREMCQASENAPLFLEAMFSACSALLNRSDDLFAPDASMINEVCQNNKIGYYITDDEPPEIKLRDRDVIIAVAVEEKSIALEAKGKEILQNSLKRSDELLSEGRGREAVQEALWLLETVTTAFRGVDSETGTIEGKYFNRIVKELRQAYSGSTLDRILEWTLSVHGYLSSPTGGGVRHGLDLQAGLEMSLNEARLFCNLIRSFLSFLLTEHERLLNN